MAFNLDFPRPELPDHALFPIESNHRTSVSSPLDLGRRRSLVDFILQAQRSCSLHPRMTYLAINYVDRLIHSQLFPVTQDISLVAVACLSLASQYSDSAGSFTVNNLKEEDGFRAFPPALRRRVLLQVVGALNSDLYSITPFAFLRFFLFLYFPLPNCQYIVNYRASQILLKIQIASERILRFKPSEIAACALSCAVYELFPPQFDGFLQDVRSSQFMDEDVLAICHDCELWETLHGNE